MNVLSKFWNNFKAAPDVWFFYGFLLTFTLSVRKVLFFYPINGQFNEWTGIYLYLSDIFLMAILFLWGISILCNKNVNLSIDNTKLWLKQAIIYLPLLLVFWSFISILWSENQNIALFKAIKLLEFCLLYLYIIYRLVPMFYMKHSMSCHPELVSESNEIPGPLRHSFSEASQARNDKMIKSGMTIFISIIIVLGFIQAIIGIWQFVIQHSIGLFWLKESLISPDISGVAKMVLNGEKFIRAYGLFPHPNILGGFLLVSIITTWAYYNMFHVEHICIGHSERAERVEESNKLDPSTKLGMTILLIIQITALILTFSKSAILGLILAFLYILWKNKKVFHMEHLGEKAIIIAIILILSLYLVGLNFGENLEKSYGDRLSQLVTWKSITQNNLLLGVGVDNYMFHMEQNYPNLETWQYQPVHNVLLLIFSELGFIGLFIFVWFLWKLFHPRRNVPCGTSYGAGVKQYSSYHSELDSESNVIPAQAEIQKNNLLDSDSGAGMTLAVFKGILLGLIFIMLFDHYLWDIQQGQIMLWLVLGLVVGYTTEKNKIFY